MSTITVETECGTRQWYDNRHDAEASKRRHREHCDECGEDDVRVAPDPDQSTLQSLADDRRRRADGAGPDTEPASVSETESTRGTERPSGPGQRRVDREYPDVPDYDDIAVKAEAITTAGETDHEYAEFRATAWRKDEGPENGYTGHATARTAEGRRGIEHRLNEVAETRAMKRAVAWATGRGPTAGDGSVESRDGETTGSTERA